MHQTAPPNSSWVQKCKRVWSATTTSHGVCKPWSQMLATAVLPPDLHRWPCSARYLSPTHALHPPKTRPKYERLQRASPALARPPHLEQASLHNICHIPLVSLHDFFHDKHQIPSMCSARRLHAHVHTRSTNTSQLVAPHMLNSFGHLIGSPNEDRLRTFHHNLRHGCQTKLTSLHKNKVEPTVLAAVCQMKQKTRCHPQDSVGANLNSCYPDLCTHKYLGHIFWHSAWHSFWLIFWHSSWHIF